MDRNKLRTTNGPATERPTMNVNIHTDGMPIEIRATPCATGTSNAYTVNLEVNGWPVATLFGLTRETLNSMRCQLEHATMDLDAEKLHDQDEAHWGEQDRGISNERTLN